MVIVGRPTKEIRGCLEVGRRTQYVRGNNRADTLAGVGVSESSCFWQQRALEIVSIPTQAPEPSAQSKLEEVNKVCSFYYEVSSEKNYPVY